MTARVWIDGQARASSDAHVSVFDRGFLYGDSVFETLRTYAGRPFALELHLDRLERSAERVLIPMPVSRSVLRSEVESAVEAAGYAESYVRLMLTRGQGTSLGLDPALSERPLRVLLVQPLSPLPALKYEQGIAAITFRTQRVGDGTQAAGAKLGNYLVAVLATHAARERGAEEALLVDAEGRLLEGATSNLFAVAAGRLVTPPEELGILSGITRAYALRAAAALGVAVDVRPLWVSELAKLDELFISSSIRELLPVVRVDEQDIGQGAPGPITQRLTTEFRRLVRA